MINKDDFMALEFIPRASSVSKIMGKKGLGKTGETYIHEYLIEKIKGVRKEFSSMYTEKGTNEEDTSIILLNKVFGKQYTKNTKYFNNGVICGTPDIIDDIVIDIKTSWDLFTFEAIDFEDKIPDNYKYQLLSYMALTEIKKSKLAYCLIDTPELLIESEIKKTQWKENGGEELDITQIINIRAKHIHNDYPEKARIIDFDLDFNESLYNSMCERIDDSRVIFNKLKEKKYKRLFN